MMDIKIYQINLDRDEDGVAFESLDMLDKYQHTNEIKAELYDNTFEGEVEAGDLEDIYRIFNIEKPEGYDGRSLSVSDVVEVISSDEVKPGCYYCDNIGFKSVSFEAEKAVTPVKQSITVVMCEPGKLAKTVEIGTRLEDLQKAVGGCIEAYYPFEEEVCIVCNDEGKFNGMRPCRAIYGEGKQLMDIVFGPFFICDCSGENFGSLSQEQIEKYTDQFRNPEHYFRQNGEIFAVPYEPRQSSLER